MTDAAALLAAILADPADDTARLVYADWLEENDQPERAEFIRVQVELARLEPWHFPSDCTLPITSPHYGQCEECKRWSGAKETLCRRERELIYGVPKPGSYNWDGWVPKGFGLDYPAGTERLGHRATLSRGFVSALACTWDAWRTHADAITRAQPIERVTLTTAPDPTPLRSRLRKMPDGREKVEEISGRYANQIYRPNAMELYLTRLLSACWPRIAFEIRPTVGQNDGPGIYRQEIHASQTTGDVLIVEPENQV